LKGFPDPHAQVAMDDLMEALRQRYRRFADRECGEYSALYYKLAHAVANDETLLSFIAGLPDRQPNLFFAAIHYLAGSEQMPSNAAALNTFVCEKWEVLSEVMRSHHTQTNEVGRCAILLPGLPREPLALIEVGASAGLCLMLDKYHYDYGVTRIGDSTSPVNLRCALEVETPLPKELPEVVWRRGLDIDPIDVHDSEKTRWLIACVWSDHIDRRQRLEAAIHLCRKGPPIIQKGDIIDDLPSLVAEAPKDALLVIFHSAVLPYVSPERRPTFCRLLASLSHERDIVWLSNEGPGVIPELDALAPESDRLRFRLGKTRFSRGCVRRELLALGHFHGWDLKWLHSSD
jgi:hypothetical protein